MNSYELSRKWFDFSFENPEKVKPNHTAMYFFIIEHCNRLGWKERFGLPTTMVMEAVGIKSYNTYIKCFNDIIKWKFIKLIEKSRNQYSSNIIAISKNNEANNKALDKALINHSTTHCLITKQSIDSINKQLNKLNKETIKQINNKTNLFCEFLENHSSYFFEKTIEEIDVESHEIVKSELYPSFEDFWDVYDKKTGSIKKLKPKWEKLSQSTKEQIMAYIPDYKKSQPDKKYRKNPETFINNESWNDEIIQSNDQNNSTKEPTINRQTASVIESNSRGWKRQRD